MRYSLQCKNYEVVIKLQGRQAKFFFTNGKLSYNMICIDFKIRLITWFCNFSGPPESKFQLNICKKGIFLINYNQYETNLNKETYGIRIVWNPDRAM